MQSNLRDKAQSVKAVFFDIDGTLLPMAEKRIPEDTLTALRRLQEKGIKVCIASGRYPGGVNLIAQQFPFDVFVTTNGQYCYIPGGEVLYKRIFDREQVAQLLNFLRGKNVEYIAVTPEEVRLNRLDGRFADFYRRIHWPIPLLCNEEWILHQDIVQFVFHVNPAFDALLEAEFPFLRAVRAVSETADVLHADGGKHVGIDAVCAHYGFTAREAIAFGDGDNDKEMLGHCGIGVAMGNAREEVKACADTVADRCDNGGIHKALAQLGLI